MQAGKLRKRVAIQQVTETRDAMGGVINTWATLATVWGDVRMVNSQRIAEDFVASADRRVATAMHRVILRYGAAGSPTITPKMRLLVDGRTLEIESVGDTDGRQATLTVLCREVVI